MRTSLPPLGVRALQEKTLPLTSSVCAQRSFAQHALYAQVSFAIQDVEVLMQTEQTIWQKLIDPLPAVLWAGVGAILAHLWQRYRNRMVVLRWQAWHQPIALSAQNPAFGTIEVRYNGNVVQNVFLSRVEIENESNKDLVNLDLNVLYTDGTTIYTAEGLVQGSVNGLLFTPGFAADLNRLLTMSTDDPSHAPLLNHLARRRDFRIPVLNRGGKANIALLVHAPPTGQNPFIHLATDSAGVKLVMQGPRFLLFGVDRNIAALVGLIFGAGLVVVIGTRIGTPYILALVAFIIGAFAAPLGAALVRALRFVRRLFG